MVGQSKPQVLLTLLSIAAASLIMRHYGHKASVGAYEKYSAAFKKGPNDKKDKVGVDGVFINRISKLLGIVIPGVFTPEFGFALLSAVMMILRSDLSQSYCDLWILSTNTKIESCIIGLNKEGFLSGLAVFFMGMAPVSAINGILKYSLREMAIRFRTRLTAHAYSKYLRGFTYYKLTNLDKRISNPDQLLSSDIVNFSETLTDLYSSIAKPVLDMVLYIQKLSGSIGASGPIGMLSYLALSGVTLTWLRKPVGNFTMREQKLEGEFRFVNSRLQRHCEAIAFYRGNVREGGIIKESFDRLISFVRKSQMFRFGVGTIDNMVAKYGATVVGFYLVSRPFLWTNQYTAANSDYGTRMEDYYKNGRMLINLSKAVGSLVLSGREMTRLAGFTARVSEFMHVLTEVSEGRYERSMLTGVEGAAALLPGSGKLEYCDNVIRFQEVPLMTPNGDVLIRSISFEVKSGMNVLIAGPNGCGKSSLFRTLGELWPLFGGTLTKPEGSKLFYIPQNPYLTLGTLRDQVVYPDTPEDMRRKGVTDLQLAELLAQVKLQDLVARESWDAVKDWEDVLSGGEKQRVAMARVFYHQPQFAILDECTSAVSVDVEGFMYTRCRELGITLFTVSHRKSLWQYHEYVLQFDGRGSYKFLPMAEAEAFGS